MKTKTKIKTKNKSQNENQKENKNENEKQNKNKNENKNKNKFLVLLSFCFSFSFCILFLLFKSFCIFVNSTWHLQCHRRSTLFYLAQKCHSIFICKFSTWPSGAIDGQLSLDWPRRAIAPRNMAPSLTRICRIQ